MPVSSERSVTAFKEKVACIETPELSSLLYTLQVMPEHCAEQSPIELAPACVDGT
jgi:hypothetical protein